MGDKTDEISVELQVDNADGLVEQNAAVLQTYSELVETFLRKNQDYGNSFEDSAKLQSIMTYGEVREGELRSLMAQQIFVRGFLDKLSRFHQLEIAGNEAAVDDESVRDTLMDLANYATMLAAQYESVETDEA
jgi:hypothetical protein